MEWGLFSSILAMKILLLSIYLDIFLIMHNLIRLLYCDKVKSNNLKICRHLIENHIYPYIDDRHKFIPILHGCFVRTKPTARTQRNITIFVIILLLNHFPIPSPFRVRVWALCEYLSCFVPSRRHSQQPIRLHTSYSML